jgi:hypothetical protein
MKHILATLALIALPLGASAQGIGVGVGTSDADANSQSASQSISGSNSAVVQTYNTPSDTTADIKSVPAVQAPSVFGGGHPCLAGQSGGLSVLGGGLSYGRGDPEVVCMLWVIGQPEAAIRALVMTNDTACKALNRVGYYRVGNKIVPFQCGKDTKVGGIDTPGVASSTTKVSTRNAPTTKTPYSKCQVEGGKIVFRKAGGASSASAKAACLRALGY